MAFCRQCGKQLEQDTRFCSSCGTPTNEIYQRPSDQNQGNNAVNPLADNFSVWQGFVTGWTKYFNIRDRARRKEYWGWTLFILIFSIGASIMDSIFGFAANYGDYGMFTLLFSLAILIPGITITIRRLHDTGHSGWIYFWLCIAPVILLFVIIIFAVFSLAGSINGMFDMYNLYYVILEALGPFIALTIMLFIWMLVGSIILLVFLCTDSAPGDNQYGPNPKQPR